MNANDEEVLPSFRLTVLGTRGSMPGEGKAYARYGGSTSCYRLVAGQEEIYLDAGSGISGVKTSPNTNLTILFTHMHLDHLIGLPFFSGLAETGRKIAIYARPREGLSPKEAVDRLVIPPFWPITIDGYPAETKFHTLDSPTEKFSLGEVLIEGMEGTHPGGSTVFRLTHRGKTIVYATDFEHNDPANTDALIKFSRRADLLLYDAQYTEAEYPRCKGYGHSTPEMGLNIAAEAEAKKLLLVHHAPWRSDEELDQLEKQIKQKTQAAQFEAAFAKIGDEIIL